MLCFEETTQNKTCRCHIWQEQCWTVIMVREHFFGEHFFGEHFFGSTTSRTRLSEHSFGSTQCTPSDENSAGTLSVTLLRVHSFGYTSSGDICGCTSLGAFLRVHFFGITSLGAFLRVHFFGSICSGELLPRGILLRGHFFGSISSGAFLRAGSPRNVFGGTSSRNLLVCVFCDFLQFSLARLT